MDLRAIARWAGLVGGLLWLLRFVLDLAGSDGSLVLDALYLAGGALLAAALVSMGAGLVRETWLKAVVGIAFPLLVWSVLEVLHPAGNAVAIDGIFGLVAAGVAVYAIVKARPERPPRARHAGAHAR